jgi:hypothetical protein
MRTKNDDFQKNWENFQTDRRYVGAMLRKYNVTEVAFNKGDYSSIPMEERAKVEEAVKRLKENPDAALIMFATGL